MLDGSYSVSDIQDYIEYVTKKHFNRIVFKIKDGYKLESQTPKTLKLFGRTKKLIDKTKNGENIPSLYAVEILLVQCNLVDNQYQ